MVQPASRSDSLVRPLLCGKATHRIARNACTQLSYVMLQKISHHPPQAAQMQTLVCPSCDKQSIHKLSEGWHEQVCSECQKPLRYLIATVRAKRSRGNKRDNTRKTSLRLLYLKKEDFIEFGSEYASDFEMRAGDVIALVYKQGERLAVIQNLTLNRYERLEARDISPIEAIIALITMAGIILCLFLIFR